MIQIDIYRSIRIHCDINYCNVMNCLVKLGDTWKDDLYISSQKTIII